MSARYLALATDYDGTLARHGRVDDDTVAALRRGRDAGITLILVSGRELESLERTFGELELFDRMVLENGALLFTPGTRTERSLADAPPLELVSRLRERGVHPLSVGRVVVATFEPHEAAVLESIRELGLEHQVIFNKGAVMVLPPGVNKAFGLRAALADLGIDPPQVVAVGDAENDHALLELCGVGAAVANALPSLKAQADLVTRADHGAGVAELIDRMIAGTMPAAHQLRVARDGTPARALSDPGADVAPDA